MLAEVPNIEYEYSLYTYLQLSEQCTAKQNITKTFGLKIVGKNIIAFITKGIVILFKILVIFYSTEKHKSYIKTKNVHIY